MPEPLDDQYDDRQYAARGEDDGQADGAGITPREVLVILRRRWPLVLAVFSIVTGIGAWRTWREPRIFESTATVRFQQSQPAVPGIGPAPQVRAWGIDPLQSEQLLIRSQSVAERVARRVGLRLQFAQANRMRREVFGDSVPQIDSVARNGDYLLTFGEADYALSSGGTPLASAPYGARLHASGISMVVPVRPTIKERSVVLVVRPMLSAAESVRDLVSTRVIPQTDVVQIIYRGRDPVIVRDVANAVAQTYAEFSSEMQLTSARNKTQFIIESMVDQKKELDAAQTRFQAFKEGNQTSDVAAEVVALLSNIHRFEGDRQAAAVEQQVYRKLLGKLTQADTIDDDLRKLGGTEAITKNTYIASLYTRWFELLKTREEQLATRNAANPDVQSTDRLITRTKTDLQSASRVYLEGVESRLQSLDQTVATLRKQAERYPPLESQQARMQADVRTAQKTYDDLLAQYQLARIAESADGATVRLVDAAALPTFAVAPNRRRAVIFAMLLGLGLSVGFAVLLERLDDSVKSPEELSARFRLPVLGLIPAIRVSERGADPNVPINRLVSHVDPRSVVAEAYRSLRTNLAFARAQSRIRTLVLTSPGPADGKSTTVANLAITFAQQGQKTLLIDGDLRRAVLDKTFSVPRSPGLTDVIVGIATIDAAVHQTTVENLHVMGSGQLPPNPSELLGSERMREVLAEARERFDMVLFDSPPLLAVTDAAVLSTIVDGVILVIRTGATTRPAVMRAAAHLRAVHSRVLGAVLNDFDAKAGSYYGGYGYYYAYSSQATNGERSRGARVVDRLRGVATRKSGTGRSG